MDESDIGAFGVHRGRTIGGLSLDGSERDRKHTTQAHEVKQFYKAAVLGDFLETAAGTLAETYAYDTASNRLLSVTRDDAGTVTTRTLGYTAGGNITSDSGHDGVAATYTYNDRNRYTALAKGTVAADYEHNALGQRVRKTVDGATTHFHYDQGGQLIAESDDTGGVLREYLYADGRRLAMAAVPSGGTPEILTLDSEHPSVTVVGSWKSSTAGGGYLGTQYETHKKANNATAWVIWPFSLNTSGDYEVYARWVDHPKRATNATYTIDNGAFSQSVQVDQTANGGAWQLLGTYTLDAAQAVTVTLTNDANDTVVADGVELRKIGGNTAPALFYYHNDHLGTPQRLTDASGNLAWDADYQPFGETDALNSSVGQAQRFPGQYADAESGFSDNYFRTYDPSIGRYTQPDPIGLTAGLNTFAYVAANPTSHSDPSGLIVGPILTKLWHNAMKTRARERRASEGFQSKAIDAGVGAGAALFDKGEMSRTAANAAAILQATGGGQMVALGAVITGGSGPIGMLASSSGFFAAAGGFMIGDAYNELFEENVGFSPGESLYCILNPIECAEHFCYRHPDRCETFECPK